MSGVCLTPCRVSSEVSYKAVGFTISWISRLAGCAVMTSPLPIDLSESPREGFMQQPRAALKLRILILDDDLMCRNVLRKMIARLGHEPLEAENGRFVLERFQCERPDVVLLDLHMPEVDGFDFLKSLRSAGIETPVITMSGGGRLSPGVMLRSTLLLGAQQSLPKPFSGDELEAAISAAMKLKHP